MKRRCEDCRTHGRTALCDLEEAGWAHYIDARTLHEFRTRQTVFREGTPASTVYILCDGEVKLSLTTSRGTSKIVKLVSARSHPCTILDKPALGRPLHSMTCTTLTEAQIACLDKSRYAWLLRHDQRFTSLILAALLEEVGSYLPALREDGAPARQRLAMLLLKLSGSLHTPVEKGVRRRPDAAGNGLFPVRRQEMAEALGITRETVGRLLGSFRRNRLIAFKGRRIDIVAPDRLRRVAGLKADT
jgi:CRP/FNR family transcriptional regulator